MSNITLEEYLNRLEQFRRRESNNQARLLPGRLPISIIIDDAGPDQSSNHCPVYNPARLLPGRYTTYASNPGRSYSGVRSVHQIMNKSIILMMEKGKQLMIYSFSCGYL